MEVYGAKYKNNLIFKMSFSDQKTTKNDFQCQIGDILVFILYKGICLIHPTVVLTEI